MNKLLMALLLISSTSAYAEDDVRTWVYGKGITMDSVLNEGYELVSTDYTIESVMTFFKKEGAAFSNDEYARCFEQLNRDFKPTRTICYGFIAKKDIKK